MILTDRDRLAEERESFLKRFKYLINEKFIDTSLNQPRMTIGDAIKEQFPEHMQKEIEEKGGIELEYGEAEVLEEEHIGNRTYYLIAQQTGYDTGSALHIYTHYYLDDLNRFLCPPIEGKTFGKRCSGIPTLKGKLLEAKIIKEKIDRKLLIPLIKNKILKDEPKQYTYDYMNDIEFPEEKDDICVVRREQENGYDYGYDTFYLAWRGYDNQLHSRKIYRGTDNKYIHISDVKFDGDNIYIKLSDETDFRFNSSDDLEKYAIPTIYKVKQAILMNLSDDGKVNFNYSIQEADNADMVILYRDNTMYQSMIKKLEILNENQNPPLRIYSIIIPANAQGIENKEELQSFIDRYNPITDGTIAQRAERETEKIEEGKEMNDKFFKELTILNMLCKKHGIKKVYLLTRVSYIQRNFLLEHGGYVKTIDGSYEAVGQDGEHKGDPVAPRKDFLKDVRIETTGFYIDIQDRYSNNSNKFTSDISAGSDTLLIVDRHCSQAAELFRKKGGKSIMIAGSYFENGQFSEAFKEYDEKNGIEDIFAETMANNVIKIYEKRKNKSK